ncbi:MAG: pilin [Candidatus Pacebacteria bacterium]|nr:pilin [Candidatus Paceibacterota bacterium]
MKKLIAIITVAVILSGGLMGVAMAQNETLNSCCHITQKITVGGVDYDGSGTGGKWIGSASTGVCDTNGDGEIDTTNDKAITPSEDWGMVCLLNTIYTVTNWVFYIMTLVAVLMIVFGGFTYITAAGDPAKAGKGKSILTFAIIGLAIALIAKLIPSLVRFILGM